MNRRPLLLAPAGDPDCLRAAVENGADAVYFGVDRINARLRAANFRVEDLATTMAELHQRGVRGYLTLNTLVFPGEWPEVLNVLSAASRAGVDAVIVQDVGLVRLAREVVPDLPVHASIQMTVTSARGVERARRLGCSQVVLARELTLSEISRLRFQMKESGQPDVPLEVFVHGALCVAYSGQCLTSEAMGGRSANRGECAQACRQPHVLVADGQEVDPGQRAYLLSPRDLAALPLIPLLVEEGIASLKIEGRLKGPAYVAATVVAYRTRLDAALANCSGEPLPDPSPETWRDLALTFSRGFHAGWLGGIDHPNLVNARCGRKRGLLLGEVIGVEGTMPVVRLSGPAPVAGDGVVFDCGRPEEPEEGGRLWQVEARDDGVVALGFADRSVNIRRVHPGDLVWQTSDPRLEERLRRSWNVVRPSRRLPVDLVLEMEETNRLQATLRCLDFAVQTVSEAPLEPARSRELDATSARGPFGRLGDTPFELRGVEVNLPSGLTLPVAALNDLRRTLVSRLIQGLRSPQPRRERRKEPHELLSESVRNPRPSLGAPPALSVLVRSIPQLLAVAATPGVSFGVVELENLHDLVPAVEAWRRAAPSGREIWVAGPRIHKPGEDGFVEGMQRAGADGYLVRNPDQLELLRGRRIALDATWNVSNALSADVVVSEANPERVTASFDLDALQLAALLEEAPGVPWEVVLHQHMPMFHMEHCVFCACLSMGRDFRDCKRPCQRHDVRLRDHRGVLHPVRADAGCRNTVFHGVPQSGAEAWPILSKAGLRHVRLDFLDEDPRTLQDAVALYRDLLDQRIAPSAVWSVLRARSQVGVTRGTLESGRKTRLGPLPHGHRPRSTRKVRQ